MVAIIGDPFLLSNYDITLRDSPTASPRQCLHVTHERSSGSKAKEGFATVTVHGDGVHIFNVSDLHIAGSYTLGPSTTFAGPSVSRIVGENETRFRRIYSTIEQSSGVRKEDHGRTVWMWDEAQAFESSGTAPEKKSSIIASHRVSRLYASEDLSDRVVLLSPAGDVTVMDIDLVTQKGEWKPRNKSPLLASYMFPRVSATFLPVQPVAPLGTLVLLLSSRGVIQVCVLLLHEDEITTALNESVIVDGTVIEASCSTSGYISCLQSDGHWRSFELGSTSPGSLSLLPISSPLRLAGLSFIENTSEATALHHDTRAVSILSLRSSHVLLCGVMQSQDLVLLLWDLRYSVVLASHRFPTPANLSTSKGVSLDLVPALDTLVLLSVSSGLLDKSSQSCSAVFVVPLTAPATSTISNAMGRASSSARWLAKPNALPNDHTQNASLDHDRRDLLDKLRSAIRQNRPEAADSAFFEWLENHSGSTTTVDSQLGGPLFGHEFVREILDIVIPSSSKPAFTLYPAKTVHYLLANRVVSAGMLSRSLLGLFAERNDWHATGLTLKNVLDLPEVDLVKLLRSVRKDNRTSGALDMQIDAKCSDVPTFSSILAACVSYPTSDAALRLTMREQLNDPESIVPILTILDDWLAELSSHETGFILDANAAGNEPSVVTPAEPCPRKAEIPPLDKVLAFLRAILDATFVTLLQHTRSHALLRRLSSHLQSELKIIDELQSLHGPLELFAKAQEKTSSEKQRPPAQLEDWRRRRKLAHERAAMGVGLYQVEELVL
ncbi:hypothetical protein BJV78DRAFT_1183009 [Lactifluus subvellereus]|nr:hypothetical protein BJV78DRAFT_1183009 [Lactifluus subvellereus]